MNISQTLKIAVVGVGGGGGNAISYINKKNLYQIPLFAMNTNLEALQFSKSTKKIQLGKKTTKGLGTGFNPNIGKESALESYEEIKENLKNMDVIFVFSTFGGGTSTGVSPVIAKICKEIGAILISIITTPFDFEGSNRAKNAQFGIEEMREVCDLLLVIPNENLTKIPSVGNHNIKYAFELIDNVFLQTFTYLIEEIITKNRDKNNILEILRQKAFLVNYKNHNLAFSMDRDLSNENPDLVNIDICFEMN